MFLWIKNLITKILCQLKPVPEVDYINGPELLPPPLSKEEEQELLLRYSNGDETVRDKLIVHNLRLVVYIARKFDGTVSSVEDLISIGTIGLIKAVKTADPRAVPPPSPVSLRKFLCPS